jgi:hypothetical protein
MRKTEIRRFRTASAILAALLIVSVGGYVVQSRVIAAHGRAPSPLAQADQTAKLERYMEAASATLDPRARAALGKIDGVGRRLLALRGYVRGEALIKTRWSWTAEEIRRYEGSAERRQTLEEVEKVRRKFSEQNPGYEIYVNTQVRTLETQIKFWNETKSVEEAADQLLPVALRELASSAYGDTPVPESAERFRQFLKASQPATVPTVATPGLSLHGQLRAFDFQVQKDGEIVATTDSASIQSVWEAQGWTKKLKDAVAAASDKFKGPLVSPREPWHYDYVP